jgi:hypothetical protein
MLRPERSEYDPYYEKYISLISEDDLIGVLGGQAAEISDLFQGVPEENGAHAYEEGKWTVKEVLGHLIDGERMFAYRIFRISRGDKTPIEGFEQDGYIENGHANGRSFTDLLEEFRLQRGANMLFFRNLRDEDWLQVGTANQVEISVRALAFIMAGHIRHHIRILKEQYLVE